MTAEQIVLKPDAAEGAVEMVITDDQGRVIQRFQRPMQWIAYEPKNAIDVGMALIDAAYVADDKLKPAGGAVKAELMERHRRTLTRRFEIMLRTMREDKTLTGHKVAEQLVSVALSEVF